VASTASGTLAANAWNSLPLSATLSPNTAYWLMYNSDGDNNLSYTTGGTNQGGWSTNSTPFGTWPASFGPAVRHNFMFSIYASSAGGPDTLPPAVTSTNPPNGATNVAVAAPVTVTFNEAMDPATITPANLELTGPGGTLVNRTVTYNAANRTATITPSSTLAGNSTYTVTVNGNPGVTDAAGNPLPTDHVTSFTTVNPAAPVVFGRDQVGAQTDSGAQNYMNGSRFVNGGATHGVTSMSVYLRGVSGGNQYQMAIYTDNAGVPGTLVASTASGTLTANAWNTLAISATLNSDTAYWLMYNTNGDNNLSFDAGAANQGGWSSGSTPFGTWPGTFGPVVRHNFVFSIYAS
jgi:hypothetical protein